MSSFPRRAATWWKWAWWLTRCRTSLGIGLLKAAIVNVTHCCTWLVPNVCVIAVIVAPGHVADRIVSLWNVCIAGGLCLDVLLCIHWALRGVKPDPVGAVAGMHCHVSGEVLVPSAPTHDVVSSAVSSRRMWKQWIRQLQGLRVTWSARVIGRARVPAARRFKHRLKQGEKLAFSQFACMQVLALQSRKGTKARCRILTGESGQGQGGGGVPSLRGGAQSKTDRILQGLALLLQGVDDEVETSEPDEQYEALYAELESMVKRRPTNILQELKSLVRKFSGDSGSSAKETALGKGKGSKGDVGKAGPPPNIKGKGKGKDKGQGQGNAPNRECNAPDSHEEATWVQVVKGKPKARDGPTKAQDSGMEVGQPRRADWTGPVATSAEALERLIADPEVDAVVALAPSPKEAELMWGLLEAHDKVDATFIFNYANSVEWAQEVGQQLGAVPEEVNVPLQFQSGLRFVRRYRLTRGDKAPKLRVQSMCLQVPTTAKKDTIVLRAMTRKVFSRDGKEWAAATTAPGSDIREWARAVVPQIGHGLKDTWGWNLAGEHLQGLIRVDVDSASKILAASGQLHAKRRWFVEPLTWAAPLPPPMAQAPLVEWQEETNLSKAAADAVAEAKRWGLGMRLGHRQVGVRKPPPAEGADSIPRRR